MPLYPTHTQQLQNLGRSGQGRRRGDWPVAENFPKRQNPALLHLESLIPDGVIRVVLSNQTKSNQSARWTVNASRPNIPAHWALATGTLGAPGFSPAASLPHIDQDEHILLGYKNLLTTTMPRLRHAPAMMSITLLPKPYISVQHASSLCNRRPRNVKMLGHKANDRSRS